jgi:hypothetical protein
MIHQPSTGIRRGTDKGSLPLCLCIEDVKHVLLSCPDTTNELTEFLFKKLVRYERGTSTRHTTNCTNETSVRKFHQMHIKIWTEPSKQTLDT